MSGVRTLNQPIDSSVEIPILSLEKLTGEKNGEYKTEDLLYTANCFDTALSQVGFVYITGHGIPAETINQAFKESMEFFNLDLQEKIKCERDFATTFHGYTQVGGVVTPKDVSIELRESFDAALADSDKFSTCAYPDEKLPTFKHAMKAMMREGRRVSKILLELLGISLLGLKSRNYFLTSHSNMDDPSIPNYSQMRTLFYPPVPAGTQAGATRCGAHTDYGTLTLILEQGIGGLEVISARDGNWVPATPIQGAILVIVGDLLKTWSGGKYASTPHRVIIPEEEIARGTPRQSIALFIKPDNGIMVSPVLETPGLILGQGKSTPEAIDAAAYFRKRTVEWRD